MNTITQATTTPCAYAMCGLAFSGKSTAARRIADELGLSIISLDAINAERGLDGGGGLPVAAWERTSHIAMSRLGNRLAAGTSALVDDTFSHRLLRDRIRGVAAQAMARFVLIYMATPLQTIMDRRHANDRTSIRSAIADDVFMAHQDSFQHPRTDEAVVQIASEADLEAWLVAEAFRQQPHHGVA